MTRTINLETHYPTHHTMEGLCYDKGFVHSCHDGWPHEPGFVASEAPGKLLASDSFSGIQMAILEHGLGLALLSTQDGQLNVRGSSRSLREARRIVEHVKKIVPPRADVNPDVVSVNFWSASQNGGRNIRRDIDVEAWEVVAENYPENEDLRALMSPDFRPGLGGQLILWHGEPGTGKTTALRALANEWREWCDLHYIVDPETFFGDRADYMMQVITAEEDWVDPNTSVTTPRWRLLVLEDCGELLQPDARREVGQALSRLLNACDGLIGRGLRLLVLVTTNEPVEKLHKAVDRPGRCAARIRFDRFSLVQSVSWLDEHGGDPTNAKPQRTLADLYGELEGFRHARMKETNVGFVG